MARRQNRRSAPTRDLAREEVELKKLEKKAVRLLSCDQVCRAWSGHRYEILTIIGLQGHLTVTEIRERLELKMSQVSRDLRALAHVGLVEFQQDKNTHLYRLAPGFVAHVHEGRVQFWLGLPNGDWLGMHREEYSASQQPVSPPTCFIDPKVHANARAPTVPAVSHPHDRDIAADPEAHAPCKPRKVAPCSKARKSAKRKIASRNRSQN